MKSKAFALAASLALTGWLPGAATAENSTSVLGYTIHHNAMTTDNLTPEVARAYGLQRSKNRGMLNVSVIKEKPGTTGEPVTAEVAASATNLAGQHRTIPMREIEDGDAIYYIGEFRIADEETLKFTVEVTPSGESSSHMVRLTQQFFAK